MAVIISCLIIGVSTEVSDTDLTNLLRTTAAQQAAELGHSTEIIKRALAAVVRRRGKIKNDTKLLQP